jgi:hypothetical protein
MRYFHSCNIIILISIPLDKISTSCDRFLMYGMVLLDRNVDQNRVKMETREQGF